MLSTGTIVRIYAQGADAVLRLISKFEGRIEGLEAQLTRSHRSSTSPSERAGLLLSLRMYPQAGRRRHHVHPGIGLNHDQRHRRGCENLARLRNRYLNRYHFIETVQVLA